MRNKTGKSRPYFMLALFTLLIIATLSLVLIGSTIYGSLVDDQTGNNQNRAVLAYLYAQVRGADKQGGISLGEGPQGQALVFREEDEGVTYETRIYLFNGRLMEEYAMEEMEFSPDRAQPVADETIFELAIEKDNLLKINTGKGSIQVALRSTGGVAK